MGLGAISWASKKTVYCSIAYSRGRMAEYVAATAASSQAVWMRRMLRSLCQEQAKGIVIFCDNSLAITVSKNVVFYKRTKHIDSKFHYIRELINMLRSLCQEQAKGTTIFCDNSLTIALSKNVVFYKRMKHIESKFHYIKGIDKQW